ncbi:MAG: hypothetical protein WCH61_00640 [bacterium]
MLVAVGTLLPLGCSFNRTVVNADFKQLDSSFIKVGKTTAYDVLDRLGPPAPVFEYSENFRLISDTHLRYLCYESRDTGFGLGYILVLPFFWSDGQVIDELLIEFDRSTGVVASVSRTQRHTIRPPLEGESARAPTQVADLTPRLAR